MVDTAQRKIIAVDFLSSTECTGGIASTEWDTQNHGTHVAGTVAGDNFAHLLTHDTADGMAPGAKLVIQDAGYLVDNCGDLPGIGCPVVDLNPIFQQAYNQGARLHTNSWGDNENAAVQNNYTAASQDVDEFMWNHKDDLIFFAAGNAGPGTGSVGSPSTAKSAVSVGATLRGTSADSMASLQQLRPDRRRPHQARDHGAGLEHRLGPQRRQHHHQQLHHPLGVRHQHGLARRRRPDGADPPVLHRRLVPHRRQDLDRTASPPRRPCSGRPW